jgi:hypothetical protein
MAQGKCVNCGRPGTQRFVQRVSVCIAPQESILCAPTPPCSWTSIKLCLLILDSTMKSYFTLRLAIAHSFCKKKLLITTARTKINSQDFKKAWKHGGAHDTFPRAPPRTQWPTDPSACHSEKLMMVHHRYVPLLCQMVQWAALLNCTYAS